MEVVNTVGRRKAAVARVYVKPGKGQITINRKALEVYFPLEILQYQVKQPLLATNTVENYDIVINLDGGGITGQASAARLCIARALAVKPEVLLMDEPTSALDPGSTMKVEELMSELKKNYTVVIVTHNMQQAARISDRTAFFLLGELVEAGPTAQIFSTPQDKRTEDYISGRFG